VPCTDYADDMFPWPGSYLHQCFSRSTASL